MPIDLVQETIISSTCLIIPDGLLKKKIETHVCSGLEITEEGERIPRNYKRTVTTTSGPKAIMERRHWSHFGITKSPPTTYGEDVFLKLKNSNDETGFYMKLAIEAKFTAIEQTAIKASDDPQETFLKILNEVYYKITNKPKKIVIEPTPDAAGIGLLLRNDRQKRKTEEYLLTVLLDNVPSWYTLDNVRQNLPELQIDRINIVKPRPGATIDAGGKVFLVLSSENEAKTAIALLHGAKWDYHVISAQISKPRADH